MGGVGLRIDSEMRSGLSASCETYANPAPLPELATPLQAAAAIAATAAAAAAGAAGAARAGATALCDGIDLVERVATAQRRAARREADRHAATARRARVLLA